jgi:uncharacterized repeat protein (TIGR03803 family)
MRAKAMLVCTFLVLTAISVGATTYKTLHNFTYDVDGMMPQAGLVFDQAGNLYGVTAYDGGDYVDGVAFELSPSFGSWKFSILHEFTIPFSDDPYPDPAGREPIGGLVMDSAGVIYGTNSYTDDASMCGTVFRSSASDWYALHSFTGPDGCIPKSNLRLSNGWLIGTTSAGGTSGQGTVFFLDTVSDTIYSYSLEGTAGTAPMGNINIFGYGTTMSGGRYGGGTVYRLGTQRLEGRYHFKSDSPTGYAPRGDLLATYVNHVRTMYGTMSAGGRNGGGTVYSLTENPTKPENWQIRVLHAFSGPDGSGPLAGLSSDAVGNLYGTTSQGGEWGCGTVFKLSPQPDNRWKFALLYSFNPYNEATGGDGCWPSSGVVLDAAGNLYGTTQGGGYEWGTVYEIIP